MSQIPRREVALASETWEAYIRTYSRLTRQFQADGSFDEVSMREYDILYALSKSRVPLTQSELMDAVVLSQPALSRLLTRLEQQGLICRSKHGSDGRASLLELTPEGRSVQRGIGRVHGKAVAASLAGPLSVEEMETLKELCDRIYGAACETGRMS